MIKTHGPKHISLAVRNLGRSRAFYQKVFGVKEYYRDESSIRVLGPGSNDVIAFDRDVANAGKGEGIAHFGFRLIEPGDIDAVTESGRLGVN